MVAQSQDTLPSYAIYMYTAVLAVCIYCVANLVSRFNVRRSRYIRVRDALKSFPGPERHWLYGNLHLMPGINEEGITWLQGWVKKFPRALTLWFGPYMPKVVVFHPETCKQILRSTEPKSVNGIGYEFLRPWLGDGLLLSKREKWFRNRRLLTPGFHFDVLKPYMDIYNKSTNLFLDIIGEKSEGGGSVEMFHHVSLCTLDIILKCAFSSDTDVQYQGDKQPYVNAVLGLSKHIVLRNMKPLQYTDAIYHVTSNGKEFRRLCKLVHDVSADVITKRKTALKNNANANEKRYPDFLDILLLARDDDGNGLTDTEIRDEVDTFLFEGHDTTASAISWALYTLAQHTKHQKKCYEEISHVFEGRDIDEMQWDDLNRVPYLTSCIKESMRMHTPVPIIGRGVEKEFVLDGVTLPMGCAVEVNVHALHHNETVWGEDHNVFKPERFDSEKIDAMDAFAFLPFSAGPRNCIGQNFAMHEIKVMLTKTLYRYQLSVDPSIPARHVPELVMRSEHGLHVFFNSRK